MPIYKKLKKHKLNKSQEENILRIRDIENVEYYKNYVFPRDFQDDQTEVYEHVWSHGDKLYKLADRYFGDRSLFWLIGLFNNKPTDSHYKYGDLVYIPRNHIFFYRKVVK